MANSLSFDQVSAILNEVVQQATGEQTIAPVDSSEFVTVAQRALLTGYDPLNTAISQVLSRTIFSLRPYTSKFNGLMRSSEQYGNHVRKINYLTNTFEDDPRYTLQDGQSIDQYIVRKPRTIQTNFYGGQPYEYWTTVYRDQLNNAMTGPSQFGEFVTNQMLEVNNEINTAEESMSRAALCNLAAALYYHNNPYQVYNVLAIYNTETGLSLTTETVKQPQNFPAFTRWLYAFINTISDRMTDRTSLYHRNFVSDGAVVLRHTPKNLQKLWIRSEFLRQMEGMGISVTYHRDRNTLPPNETVNFWQSPTAPEGISMTPSVVSDTNGNAEKAPLQEIPNLIAIMHDRETVGVTDISKWSAPSPFNAHGGYTNYWWHWTTRWWNDESENAAIFIMEDVPTP